MAEQQTFCDFCHDPVPRWRYGCQDFSVVAVSDKGNLHGLQESTGSWHACNTCKEMIDANDREALLSRTVERFLLVERPNATAAQREFIRKACAAHFDGFFRLRTGPAEVLYAER